MKYYVLFLRQRSKHNIFARAIQLVMNNEANHVEILEWPDGTPLNEATSFGAVSPKSRAIKFKDLCGHYYIERWIELETDISPASCHLILQSLTGKYYSPAQILVIMMKLVFGKLLSFLPYVKLNLTKYLICTELVGVFMQEACSYRFEQSCEALTINEVEQIALQNLKRFS